MCVRSWLIIAVVCLLAGCSEKPASPSPAPGAASLILKALHPNGTPATIKFNVQSNGAAAIAVECENATRETVILFDNHPLTTAFGSSSLLSAEVPAEYFSAPRVISVSLKGPSGQSGSLQFVVK